MTDSRNLYCCSYLLCILYVCLTLLRTPNLTQKLQDLWHFQTERLVRHIRLELFPAQLSKKNKIPPSRLKSAKDLNIQHSPTQSNSATPHTNKKTSSQTGPKKINPFLSHQYTLPSKSSNQKVPKFLLAKKKQIGNKKIPIKWHLGHLIESFLLGSFRAFYPFICCVTSTWRVAVDLPFRVQHHFFGTQLKWPLIFVGYLLWYYVGAMQKDPYKNLQTSAIASTQYRSGTWGISFIIKPSVAYATAPDTSWVSG